MEQAMLLLAHLHISRDDFHLTRYPASVGHHKQTSGGLRFPMHSNRRDIQLLHKRFLIPLTS